VRNGWRGIETVDPMWKGRTRARQKAARRHARGLEVGRWPYFFVYVLCRGRSAFEDTVEI
jgi:hypothetical protein